MPQSRNRPANGWKLNSFLDSLILELDKAQDVLAVKGINRRLTYTVKDLALDLHLFPDFDGGDLRFTTARPGESGAARVSFQLGSITNDQIRETTREPLTRDDMAIESVEGLDDQTKTELMKMGVSSVRDLERMERRKIDLRKASDNKVDYGRLANVINRARRHSVAPTVAAATLDVRGDTAELHLEGENLALPHDWLGDRLVGAASVDFPRASLNGSTVRVLVATPTELRLDVPTELVRPGSNDLRVLLDPYAVISMQLDN